MECSIDVDGFYVDGDLPKVDADTVKVKKESSGGCALVLW